MRCLSPTKMCIKFAPYLHQKCKLNNEYGIFFLVLWYCCSSQNMSKIAKNRKGAVRALIVFIIQIYCKFGLSCCKMPVLKCNIV